MMHAGVHELSSWMRTAHPQLFARYGA